MPLCPEPIRAVSRPRAPVRSLYVMVRSDSHDQAMTVSVMATARYDPFCRKRKPGHSGSGPLARAVPAAVAPPAAMLAVLGVPPPGPYWPVPGHHAPAVPAVPGLFRVSVTIVTLTRNKSRALAGKPGIPGIRSG
jgi:hypothetical protein